jgi:regulator of sigma E protease
MAVVWNWELVWVIVQVALGLGAVIFVHELGHFLVAKACGVKCEKFYIGFDIGGWKLFSRTWGETQYGIGILPLGGYVKMLGQDDNPARMAEEMERARLRGGEVGRTDDPVSSEDRTLNDRAAAEGAKADGAVGLDPRSYPAKTVPQRMAIISAGVLMNLLFAVLFAAVAYAMGVPHKAPVVSDVVPGSPAWKAGLRAGDRVTRIGELADPRFTDLQGRIALGDIQEGIPLVIQRETARQPLTLTLRPEQGRGLVPTIGIVSASRLVVHDVLPGTPAAAAEPPILPGDLITAIDGQPIETQGGLSRALMAARSRPVELTVVPANAEAPRDRTVPSESSGRIDSQKGDSQKSGNQATRPETRTTRVPPAPMKVLGLVMQIGPIAAIKDDSPASRAGLKSGDTITEVAGEPVGDPMTLPQRIDGLAGSTVMLEIRRPVERAEPETVQLEVDVEPPQSFEMLALPDGPVSVPSLGLAYHVLNRVAAVEPDSPAFQAGVRAGAELVEATFVGTPLDADDPRQKAFAKFPAVEFGPQQRNWPLFFDALQSAPEGVMAKLTLRDEGRTRVVELAARDAADAFVPTRGLVLEPLEETRKAASLMGALRLGLHETGDAVLMVYRFLQKIGTQISVRAVGGPLSIATAAGQYAYEGPAKLLIFLTVLSANLAVINFLPVPLLDGGHMVFLALEGLIGRPVSERIVVAFHTLGFVLIIGLLIFVLALDFGVIPRGV